MYGSELAQGEHPGLALTKAEARERALEEEKAQAKAEVAQPDFQELLAQLGASIAARPATPHRNAPRLAETPVPGHASTAE